MTIRTTVLAGLAAVGLVGAGVQVSKADTYKVFENACNSGLGCDGSTTVIAQITTSQDGSNIKVDIKLVDSDFSFFQGGNPPMVGINTNPQASGMPTAPTSGPAGSTWSLTGNTGSLGTVGSFTNGLGFLPKSNETFSADIVFDLSGVTLSDFLANASNYVFAVDLCHGAAGTAGCSGGTGFAGAVLVPVPGPIAGAGIPGLIVACGGLVALGRRRRQRLA